MLIRLGYDLKFEATVPVPMLAMLNVHSSRIGDLREPDILQVDPAVPLDPYYDSFGNLCTRLTLPPGTLRLHNSTLVEDSGLPDPVQQDAREVPIAELPTDVLQFLLASRYCEVDALMNTATELFGHLPRGWAMVQGICDWVHSKVTFGYPFARYTKTAMDVYVERTGVCRDFQHLAVTFCRCMNIPARYVTGYLGDIGVPPSPSPMDFSAWFEAYLDGRWWTFDARHNRPRLGRVLMAVGRDAADVALTTSFGNTRLTQFIVISDEITDTPSLGI
jgi:transglutaminase-like putative cysteine protease